MKKLIKKFEFKANVSLTDNKNQISQNSVENQKLELVKCNKLYKATIYKELADYTRYLAEFEELNDDMISEIEAFYKKAIFEINIDKSANECLRLSIGLNNAIFNYEFKNRKRQTYEELAEIYEETVLRFNDILESDWKEITKILIVVEKNLDEWKEEMKISKKRVQMLILFIIGH